MTFDTIAAGVNLLYYRHKSTLPLEVSMSNPTPDDFDDYIPVDLPNGCPQCGTTHVYDAGYTLHGSTPDYWCDICSVHFTANDTGAYDLDI